MADTATQFSVGDQVTWRYAYPFGNGEYVGRGTVTKICETGAVEVQFENDPDDLRVLFQAHEAAELEAGWPDGWDDPDYEVEP